MPFDSQDYLFDLRGYHILKQAVDPQHVSELNAALDVFPHLEFEQWHGNVQRFDNNGHAGVELQNIVEGGEPFERLIDHPAWIERLLRYCGEYQSYVQGLFIDECFASIRRTGGFFPLHSGGHEGNVRNQYRMVDGRFRCGQVNILLALTDIGPGDGGTVIVPGSHKSQFTPPMPPTGCTDDFNREEVDHGEGVMQVNLKKGDALMFVDAIRHGASTRTNPGERRVVIYRYGVSWGSTRHGYQYSEALLDRLSPAQRKILQPIAPRLPDNARSLQKPAPESMMLAGSPI